MVKAPLPLLGPWVWSLAGKLRSRVPLSSMAKYIHIYIYMYIYILYIYIIQITSFHYEIVEWLFIGLRIKPWPKALYNLALPTYLTTSHTILHSHCPSVSTNHRPFALPTSPTWNTLSWSILSSGAHLLGLSWNSTTSGMLDMNCFSLFYHLV